MIRTHNTHVFLHELPWDYRSRNTDWRYVRYALPRLREFEADLMFTGEKSWRVSAAGNLKAIATAVGRRVGFTEFTHSEATSRLARAELKASGCNVIFSRTLPLNAGNIPVVLENAVVDPEMQLSYGATKEAIAEEYETRGKLFRRAAAIQVFSDAEARRHAAVFPDIATRFVAVPWFAPHIKACAHEELDKHRAASPVRILFVGNNAYRKGLDLLFRAFVDLPETVRRRSLLTIISNFDRSPMKIPVDDRIVILRGAPVETVMTEMRRAHIFVNVARLETYGVVFHEAMSQGLACLAPAWEVQRELFDNGRAGLNLTCDSPSIRNALEHLIEDETYRHSMGLAAWERFQERFAPAVVARRYGELFRAVAGGIKHDASACLQAS